jgi:hypothetical protein
VDDAVESSPTRTGIIVTRQSMKTDPTVHQKLTGCSSRITTVRKYALPVKTAVTHAMIKPAPNTRTIVTFSG